MGLPLKVEVHDCSVTSPFLIVIAGKLSRNPGVLRTGVNYSK